jgi:CHASE1-domain containing sensor protein
MIKGLSATRPTLWIGFPLSLCVGLMLYMATATTIEADSRQRFSAHAHHARNTIVARVKSYTDLVRGTAAMFRSNYPITRLQFHNYVDGLDLDQQFPAIESINFSEFLYDATRAEFEKRMAKEPLADGSLPTVFKIIPPGRRDKYSIVTFVEPPQQGPTIGVDMLSSPALTAQHMTSRDTGELGTSGIPIKWVKGGIRRTGLAMRVPIYAQGKSTNTVQERRTAFLGSVGIAFSVDRLMMGVIDEMPVKNAHMTLVDNALLNTDERGKILFNSAQDARPQPRKFSIFSDRFSHTLVIDFNTRKWDATFSVDAHEMYSGFEEFMPWLAMFAGIVSTMLLYALFHALTSSRQRAIKLAKGMTRELRESQNKLQLSHQNLRRLAAHADQIKEGELHARSTTTWDRICWPCA